MSDCGGCSACSIGDDKAQEYKNHAGRSAVKCTLCDREIVFDKLPRNRKVRCDECGTVVEVIPLLLN